jgi:tripartite-type tricarboxylate transporter receptor subunit TctC
MQYRALCHVGTIASVVLMALCVSASAQTVEEFYRGKQIRLIVGSAEGAGFDTYARLLANFMGKYSREIRRSSCRTCRAPVE